MTNDTKYQLFKVSEETLRKKRDENYFLDDSVVKFALKQRNMTTQELADAVGYSRSSVLSSLFSGKTKPRKKQVAKMAKVFGCKPKDLLIAPSKVPAWKRKNYEDHALNSRITWNQFNERNLSKHKDSRIQFLIHLREEIDDELERLMED